MKIVLKDINELNREITNSLQDIILRLYRLSKEANRKENRAYNVKLFVINPRVLSIAMCHK